MATKINFIFMVIIALIVSCKPLSIKKQTWGKDIQANLRYTKPIKLGDTIWLSYNCNINDLINGSITAKNDFKTYTAYSYPVISFKKLNSVLIFNIGKYLSIKSDYPNTSLMYFNPVNNNFELSFGFIPNRVGNYVI